MKLAKNNIALAGEFAVLSQLALRGYDANLTLGNTKGVDILVSNPVTGNMYRIEVKTTPKTIKNERFLGKGGFHYWLMKSKHEHMEDDDLYFCFVLITEDNGFRFFLMKSVEVAKVIRDSHTEYIRTHPHIDPESRLMRKMYLASESNSEYTIPVPVAQEYENNWDILD